MVSGAWQVQSVDLASNVARSQSNQTAVKCAGWTRTIHKGFNSQLKGIKGSDAKVLVPDTTSHKMQFIWV